MNNDRFTVMRDDAECGQYDWLCCLVQGNVDRTTLRATLSALNEMTDIQFGIFFKNLRGCKIGCEVPAPGGGGGTPTPGTPNTTDRCAQQLKAAVCSPTAQTAIGVILAALFGASGEGTSEIIAFLQSLKTECAKADAFSGTAGTLAAFCGPWNTVKGYLDKLGGSGAAGALSGAIFSLLTGAVGQALDLCCTVSSSTAASAASPVRALMRGRA